MLDLGTLRTTIRVEGADSARSALNSVNETVRTTETGFNNFESESAKATSKMKEQWSSFKSTFVALALTQIFTELAKAITACVDSAIDRVDTLNRFPKVMQSLGYSAEEANASLQKIGDSIEGLPTTLDDAVGGVQRLTAATGDLNLSTDLWAALNDMVYANGASSEKAASAMEQLTQMISAQKVDATAWRSVMEACPGALNQLAKSMLGANASANDLYDGLQSGTVSFKDFYDAVIKIDTEGGAGLASFAEQAQTAVGGISTAMGNAKTAITKNVANIIDTLNENGEIEQFFKDLKQVINDVGKTITEAIPAIKDFIASLQPLLPVIIGITAAVTAFKAAMAIVATIQAVTSAINAFKAANEAATIAQAALNAVMNANPIVLIITLVAGLIAAIVTLWNTNEEFRNAVIELWDTISTAVGEAVNAIVETVTSWVEGIGAAIDSIGQFFTDLWNGITTTVKNIWDNVTTAFSNGVEAAINFVSTLPERILSFFSNAGTWLVDAGGKILQGLWDGISSGLSWLGDKLGSIGQFIIDHKGPPQKDAKLLTENGKKIMQSLVDGITQTKVLDDALKGISTKISKYDMGTLNAGITAASFGSNLAAAGAGGGTTSYYSFGDINITASDVSDVSTIEDFVSMLKKAKNVNPTKKGW